MRDYVTLILAMKFGFSAVLLFSGVYGLVALHRAKRSLRAFLSLPGALALVLLIVSALLLVADHEKYYDFLNLVKIISGVFTLIYGIYATLNDFYEQDETGRRAITRIGMVGILLFFTSTIFSIAADYVKNSIQKEEIDERRRYYARIVDKLVIVDQSTGKLNINFQKFTENLFLDLKRTQQELLDTRRALADREGRVSTLERQVAEGARELKAAEARVESQQFELGGIKERLSAAEERAREGKAKLDDTAAKLDQASRGLAARRAELGELRKQLGETADSLRKKDAELGQAVQETARSKEELRRMQSDVTDWRKRADEIGPVREALGRREAELTALQAQLEEARRIVKRLEGDARRSRRLLEEKMAELALGQRALERSQKDLVTLQRELIVVMERLKTRPAEPARQSKVEPGS